MKMMQLKDCDDEIFSLLALIDSEIVEKYRDSFSEEKWGIANFKYKLPLKSEMSLISFNDSGEISGYCIASLKMNSSSYIHRFVGLKYKQKNISNELIQAFISINSNIYLLVNKTNLPGIAFYKANGFIIINAINELTHLQPILFPNSISKMAIFNDKYLMYHQ